MLYHATYACYLQSILDEGLGAKQPKNWDFSEDGRVYFAYDRDVAESFAEISEEAPSEVLKSGIVILVVNEADLDGNKFYPDRNMLMDEEENAVSIAYQGVIPPSLLKVA